MSDEKLISRREFIKQSALTTAAIIVCGTLSDCSRVGGEILKGAQWTKGVCRFCGTGCGMLVGTKKGRVVAVRGDPENPVNRGLLCVKGYHVGEILYGKDRLTRPLIRKKDRLVRVSWEEALDLVATRFKESIEKYGPDSVAMYGSGQWTIPEGYAALKLMKAGIGTNNLEANARLCMSSAVAGFMTTFGSDEPMGCYDDLDEADTVVFWGCNSAEMHPVLFSRIVDRKAKRPWITLVDIGTRRTRTTAQCDLFLEFKPNTDLALANGLAHILFRDNKIDVPFIEHHVAFKKGLTQIGYGLEDKFSFKDEPQGISLEEYRQFLSSYTPDHVASVTGLSVDQIEKVAKLYGDKERKVLSLWCMGVNQHTRGTWMNNLIYNLHLLTGKIGKPGNSAFSLTGQPSACGTVREVGTLCNRLPADRVVTNEEHRKLAAQIWKVPLEKIPAKPGWDAVEMFRALDRGEIKIMWVQCTNPYQTLPKVGRYRKTAEERKSFIVVSDIYPTATTALADVVLPSACWVEKEGFFGNSERRTQHWPKMVDPPGEAREDLWQMVEVAKRLGLGELFSYPSNNLVRELFEEYRQFTVGTGKDLAPYESYQKARGLRWPVVEGKETRYRYVEGEDPYVPKGTGLKFYKNKQDEGRAVVWARPYELPPESPDAEYPFWLCTGRVLEHWHTGTMTRRVKELHRAIPRAVCEIHPEDAKVLGIFNGDTIRLKSRRGEILLPADINGRSVPPKGVVFVPFFEEEKLINLLTLDAYCPISKQPDYKKCAVKVEKA